MPHAVPSSCLEGHSWLTKPSFQDTFSLLDLWVAFRTVDSYLLWDAFFFWFQDCFKLLISFLVMWLFLCCFILVNLSCKCQSSTGSSPRRPSHHFCLFYSSHRHLCPWFQLLSTRVPNLYIESDLCSKLYSCVSSCLLPVDLCRPTCVNPKSCHTHSFHLPQTVGSLSQKITSLSFIAFVIKLINKASWFHSLNLPQIKRFQVLQEQRDNLSPMTVNSVHCMVFQAESEWSIKFVN